MLQRILTLAIVAALGYWYWSGPYKERVNPSYEQKLRHNAKAMRDCIYRKNYAANRTTSIVGDLQETCMQELNLYQSDDGQWHSYDDVRGGR
jgi:hypothetical protein